MTEKDEIILPTEPHEPEINATSMIIFGKEKCGKTTAFSQLENCLIIDTENGSKKVKVKALVAPQDKGPVGKMQWLKKVAEKLSETPIYDYVVIDTLSEVNEWSEWSGTWRYMHSAQGKSFNRVGGEKGGEMLDPGSDDYQSVHNLGEGYGYRWSRDEMLRIFDMFLGTAKKCVFFVCHVEDKFISLKEKADEVPEKQLALTGQLRRILPRKVDAIGYVYNKDDKLMVNFSAAEDKLGGTRAKHLVGYNGPLDWNKIFIN